MRHNSAGWGIAVEPADAPAKNPLTTAPIRRGAFAFLFCATILAMAPNVFAEKPLKQPDPKEENRQKRISEIDESWMKAIHSPQAEENSAPKGDNKGETKPDSAQSQNSNQSNPSSTETSPRTDTDPRSFQNPGPGLFPEEKPSFVSTVVRFFLMFLIMIAMFYFVTRYLKSKSVGGTMGDLARTLGSVPLAPGKHLQLVELAGKILVLGVSDAGVQLVHAVEDARTADKIRLWHDSRPTLPAPETILQKLVQTLSKTDLKFWSKKPASFMDHLNDLPETPLSASTPRTDSRNFQTAAQNAMTETTMPASATREEQLEFLDRITPEEQLKTLLRDQKNRLKSIKEQNKK